MWKNHVPVPVLKDLSLAGDTSYLRVCDGRDRCKSEVYIQSGENRVTHSAGGVSGKAVSRTDTDRV